jgi:hypothetical protein
MLRKKGYTEEFSNIGMENFIFLVELIAESHLEIFNL